MESTFVFAEPENLIIDLSKIRHITKEYYGFEFEKPCTLREFGKFISGWKLYGYFVSNNKKTRVFKAILDEIHIQHPTVDFKLHFWYEENIMFYFCWKEGPAILSGQENDCAYFVNKQILEDASQVFNSLFNFRNTFVSRYESNHTINTKYITEMYEEKEKNKDLDSTYTYLLHIPSYLRCVSYFKPYKLEC